MLHTDLIADTKAFIAIAIQAAGEEAAIGDQPNCDANLLQAARAADKLQSLQSMSPPEIAEFDQIATAEKHNETAWACYGP